jgi:hypothetical protein
MATKEKVRETRLRFMADRQGLRLTKSRTRDPRAMDYGLYALIDVQTGGAINPAIADRWTHSWSLDEVETCLQDGRVK